MPFKTPFNSSHIKEKNTMSLWGCWVVHLAKALGSKSLCGCAAKAGIKSGLCQHTSRGQQPRGGVSYWL